MSKPDDIEKVSAEMAQESITSSELQSERLQSELSTQEQQRDPLAGWKTHPADADYCWNPETLEVATKKQVIARAREDMTCVTGVAIESFVEEHPQCPVYLLRGGVYRVCTCECRPCKREWFAAGRPIVLIDGALRFESGVTLRGG